MTDEPNEQQSEDEAASVPTVTPRPEYAPERPAGEPEPESVVTPTFRTMHNLANQRRTIE